MRILQVLPRVPYPPRDGGAIAMAQTAQHLQALGHQVEAIALNPPNHRFEGKLVDLPLPLAKHGIENDPTLAGWLFNWLFSSTPYPVARFIEEDFAQALQVRLQTHAYDAVVLETLYMLPYAATARAVSQAPIVLRSHNQEGALWLQRAKAEPNPLKAFALKQMARRLHAYEAKAHQEVDAIAAIAPEDATMYSQAGASRVHIVPPTILPHWQPGPNPEEEHTVGYMGALDWPPNTEGMHWFVTQCWPQIAHDEKGYRLEIAGRVHPKVASAWQYHGATMLGPLDSHAAEAFWQRVAVSILPVHAASGVRLKLLEAAARGKAIVSTSKGVLGTSMQHEQHLLIGNDTQNFCGGVWALLESAEYRQRLGQAARQYVLQHHQPAAAQAAWATLLAQLA